MKRHLVVMVSAALILAFTACKKNQGFDPMTKSENDFIGTWHGTITTFKNNRLLKESGEVVIFRESETSLAGIIYMNEKLFLREFQFQNGTLYFKITCPDPLNVNCQVWNLGGYAVFKEEGKIDFRLSGNECGSYGNEYVDWSGTLASKEVSADSIPYFNFAANGHSWVYSITKKFGDTCNIVKKLNENPSAWYFRGLSTNTCDFTSDSLLLRWTGTPAELTLNYDSTLCTRPMTFPIWAKTGVSYRTIDQNDTTTVTLVDTSVVVNTAAGDFNCLHYRYTEPAYSGTLRYTRISHLWIDKRFGIIRHEVENPADTSDIKLQVLKSKNF